MSEHGEYRKVKARVDWLMDGNGGLGNLDDTAVDIFRWFGVQYSVHEIHAIWSQGQAWAPDYDQVKCCGNVAGLGHGELCPTKLGSK